jgi:predicted dehydrogenase
VSARLQAVVAPRAVRLGFIGLGWIGRTRLDAIACDSSVEVAALHDADAARLGGVASAYPRAHVAASLGDLLTAGIDGVVIATPNGLHADQSIAALERGVAVFCQKPLTTSAADARAVVEAAERANRLLGVDYCYRHVNGMADLRRRIRAGELGELLAVELTFHNAYGPDNAWCHDRRLAGGGCLLDLGVHLLDLASWLHGSAAAAVQSVARYAQGRLLPPGDPGIEDLAFATLSTASGATVRIACSWHSQSGRDAIIEARLIGARGGAVWANVGGSFYDFELHTVQGPKAQRLAAGPDEWAPRALRDWIRRIGEGEGFDPEARRQVELAELVDRLYAA